MSTRGTVGTCNSSNTKSRNYIIVINNPVEEDHIIIKRDTYKYTYQLEQESTKHIQGVVSFKNPRSFEAIKKLFPRAHIEKCKNLKNSITYCTKTKTRIGGPWSTHIYIPKDNFDYNIIEKWQRDILELIKKEPDDRKINWYWERTGKRGKSRLARHICINDSEAIYVCGKAKDIKFAIVQRLKKGKRVRVVIWDLSREQRVSYNSLEQVKNGIFFSPKYEAEMVIYDSPHIIIFSNEKPEKHRLSLDRWNIVKIPPLSSPPSNGVEASLCGGYE